MRGDYQGRERRYLDTAHPAQIQRYFHKDVEHATVYAGETSIDVTPAEADRVAFVHNYMNGHLAGFAHGLPKPTDRRWTPRGLPSTAREVDALWHQLVEDAARHLEDASEIDAGRGGSHYRAASLHALALKVQEVRDA